MCHSLYISQQYYSLVICEKPSVAKRIAQALSTYYHDHRNYYSDKPSDQEQKNRSQPPQPTSSTLFATIRGLNGQDYIICHALGHLYGLSDTNKGSRKAFPVLDPTWLPLSILKKKGPSSKFLAFKIEKILREISQVSKKCLRLYPCLRL